MPEFYDDIEKYLESIDNNTHINIKGFENLVYKICAHTGVSHDAASIILSSFFQEIRNAMLRGDIVSMNEFGKFYISSPLNSGNKKKMFPKFKPHKELLDLINNDRFRKNR